MLLALTAADGGRGPGSRPSGAGEGAEEAHSGRRSREPGTERPRPWRTPISSSTSSSATQVRPAADCGGSGRAGGANGGGAGRRGSGGAAPPILPRSPGRRSISAVLALVTWALRAAAAWLGLPCSARARCSRARGSRLPLPESVTAGRPSPGAPSPRLSPRPGEGEGSRAN